MKDNTMWNHWLRRWRMIAGIGLCLMALWAAAPLVLVGQDMDEDEVEEYVDDFDEEDEEEEDEDFERPGLDDVYAFLEEAFPEAREELEWAEEEGSVDEFQDVLDRSVEFLIEYRERDDEDPENARLFLELARARLVTHRLVDRYWEAEGARDRDRWRGELETAVEVWFDYEIALEEHDLALLIAEVRAIEDLLETRKRRRTEEIRALLADVLGDEDGEDFDEDRVEVPVDGNDGTDTVIVPDQL